MPVHDCSKVVPNIFHHFHSTWLTHISDALNQSLLPEDHFAAIEQFSGEAVPDVLTLRERGEDSSESPYESQQSIAGMQAVATAPPEVDEMFVIEQFAERQKHLVIYHSAGHVVALIELVSSANKQSRKGLARFVDKILSALVEGIHVLVLDVLPPGSLDPQGMHGAVWSDYTTEPYLLPAGKTLTLASYNVRSAYDVTRFNAYVQPTAVGEPLRSMPIFLTAENYVEVPLEATYQQAWQGMPRQWQRLLDN